MGISILILGFKGAVSLLASSDQFRFLGNCPPTPPLTQHFAPSETQTLNVELRGGVGGQFPRDLT